MKEKKNYFKGVLTLKNPVMIDGKSIGEISYDSNEINGTLFVMAEAKKKAAAGMKNTTISPAAEFDTGLHLYLGFAVIIAVNPSYDFSDLERIKGRDVVEVMAIGRNFILTSEQGQQGSGSGGPTEITPESTTQARLTSKVKE